MISALFLSLSSFSGCAPANGAGIAPATGEVLPGASPFEGIASQPTPQPSAPALSVRLTAIEVLSGAAPFAAAGQVKAYLVAVVSDDIQVRTTRIPPAEGWLTLSLQQKQPLNIVVFDTRSVGERLKVYIGVFEGGCLDCFLKIEYQVLDESARLGSLGGLVSRIAHAPKGDTLIGELLRDWPSGERWGQGVWTGKAGDRIEVSLTVEAP